MIGQMTKEIAYTVQSDTFDQFVLRCFLVFTNRQLLARKFFGTQVWGPLKYGGPCSRVGHVPFFETQSNPIHKYTALNQTRKLCATDYSNYADF